MMVCPGGSAGQLAIAAGISAIAREPLVQNRNPLCTYLGRGIGVVGDLALE
jgi:hypothetical protein